MPDSEASTVKPLGCTHAKLRQLARAIGRLYDPALAAAGLKTTQYSLLSHLLRLAPVRPGVLAERMAMDASTLTRNLQPLVAQGWATVGPGDDGRSRVVVPTDAGRAKHAEARQAWQRAQRTLEDRLGHDRVAQLHALIDDSLARLRQPSETSGDTDDDC